MTTELLPIRTFGDPILRERAQPIETFGPALAHFAERMRLTMDTAGGKGLAGNQVGLLRQLFVWRDTDASAGACVNPEVLAVSEETGLDEEGCMSFPRLFRFAFERPLEVHVRYRDVSGGLHEATPVGRLARTFLHEIDHLNGVLFIDHLAAHERARAEQAIAAGMLDDIPQPNGGPTPPHDERLTLQ